MTQPHETSWSDLVHAALERVGRKVIERAEQTGTPVIVWEDGRVVELSPQTLRERMRKGKSGTESAPARPTDS